MNLKDKIQSLNYEIEKFHYYISQQTTALVSQGKVSENLDIYLFDAYDRVPGEEFKATISRKQSEYYMVDENITADDLMRYAQNCYDIRVTNTSNPWMHKSKEQIYFEALPVTVKELRYNNSKIGKALKAKIVTRKTKGNKTKAPNIKGIPNTGTWDWKDVAPQEG